MIREHRLLRTPVRWQGHAGAQLARLLAVYMHTAALGGGTVRAAYRTHHPEIDRPGWPGTTSAATAPVHGSQAFARSCEGSDDHTH